jgi:hypothetical protein
MGCQVCGAGIDYSWGPGWVAIKPGTFLISTQLYLNVFEYLCESCHSWAKQLGVLWDGKLTFGFTGWRVKPNGDVAGTIRAPMPRIRTVVRG